MLENIKYESAEDSKIIFSTTKYRTKNILDDIVCLINYL